MLWTIKGLWYVKLFLVDKVGALRQGDVLGLFYYRLPNSFPVCRVDGYVLWFGHSDEDIPFALCYLESAPRGCGDARGVERDCMYLAVGILSQECGDV